MRTATNTLCYAKNVDGKWTAVVLTNVALLLRNGRMMEADITHDIKRKKPRNNGAFFIDCWAKFGSPLFFRCWIFFVQSFYDIFGNIISRVFVQNRTAFCIRKNVCITFICVIFYNERIQFLR